MSCWRCWLLLGAAGGGSHGNGTFVLVDEMMSTDQAASPGSSAIPMPQRNTTLEPGYLPGTAETLGENIEMDIIVAAVFIGLVMLLMAAAIYLTWKRRGQEQRNWEEQVAKESLAQGTEKQPR